MRLLKGTTPSKYYTSKANKNLNSESAESKSFKNLLWGKMSTMQPEMKCYLEMRSFNFSFLRITFPDAATVSNSMLVKLLTSDSFKLVHFLAMQLVIRRLLLDH